ASAKCDCRITRGLKTTSRNPEQEPIMNTQIQQDERQRPHIFQRVLELAHRYYEQEDNLPPGRYVADIPFEDLPNKGKGALNTLNFFDERYSSLIPASAGPRYFAFVTGGSTPAAVAG